MSVKYSSKKQRSNIEGTIYWESLDCLTNFLGVYSPKLNGSFKIREYELIEGDEDKIEIPTNYIMNIKNNRLSGKTFDEEQTNMNDQNQKEEAKIDLEFCGINDRTEGTLHCK